MPLLFSSIPQHLQLSAMKKLDFLDFTRLRQCSKGMSTMTNFVRCGLPLEVFTLSFYCETDFPVHVKLNVNNSSIRKLSFAILRNVPVLMIASHVEIEDFETNEQLLDLEPVIGTFRIQAMFLDFHFKRHSEIKLSIINRILKEKPVEVLLLTAYDAIFTEYDDLSSFQNIPELRIRNSVTDDLLAALPCPKRISVINGRNQLTSEGMNAYFKNPKTKSLAISINREMREVDDQELFHGFSYRRAEIPEERAHHGLRRHFRRQNDERVYFIQRGQIRLGIYTDGEELKMESLNRNFHDSDLWRLLP